MNNNKKVKAIIFDLDGVIVSSDELHYQGWKQLADEEGIYFDREINQRLRGVSRMESLEILLEKAPITYTEEQKIEMASRKNSYYRQLLDTSFSPADILPGVMNFLKQCRENSLKIAVGSSSRNSPTILQQIGLADYFDATADGNDITNSKPNPEVFLLAAERMKVPPEECLVVEDAEAGVTAAIAGGMKCLAVGFAANDPRATFSANDLAEVDFSMIKSLL